ncbi:methyltransferase-like protein 17, mitochondrial [Trichonephila clavata]|uniref:Methyltransferase-like protein 17, mitochondrial n=1 Tax=Trichonephila clavata TaxID=2740835 RepID=A0A8X6IS15_TRICU|nr:methyltransferase-like protein 17, mitochondrial [Trichonephila clavata]
MYPVKTAFVSFDANKAKILNAAKNIICYSNKCCFSSKSSVELLPEILRLLDSNNMKHRKHPGVKKIPPIQLPSLLTASIYKLISNANEKNILIAAKELNNFLVSRRLPIEQIEKNWRIRKILNLNDNNCELNEITEEQRKKTERQIKSELGRWKPLEYGRFECLAYMAARMPANYASIFKIFSEIKSQLPEYQPKTFFDFGSGVGSAVWAAQAIWNESLSEYFCVDSSSDMNDVAETLLTDEKSGDKYVKNIFFRQFLPASENIKYDLVVSAFSLLDLPSATDRLRIIDTLWRKTKDILVIIEFGNLAGFFSILDARDYILQVVNNVPGDIYHNSSQGHIVIPCPHEMSCPKVEPGYNKTCGVSVSYQCVFPRHRTNIKKDWISYVVLRKGPKPKDSITWPRLVEPVIKKSRFVICRICCNNGRISELTLSKHKHGRHAYRCARSSTLGDSLPFRELPGNIKDIDKE